MGSHPPRHSIGKEHSITDSTKANRVSGEGQNAAENLPSESSEFSPAGSSLAREAFDRLTTELAQLIYEQLRREQFGSKERPN